MDSRLLQRARQTRRLRAAGRDSGRLSAAPGLDAGVRRGFAYAALASNGGGLFELRPKGREGIGRVFYCTHVGQRVVVLHSFVKKTQETPQNELRTARVRLSEVRNG
ncbi:type II toxin-antitoxin system RelE/ParE family toxin [Burkholderia pseudomallei]|uniref:Putative bacteriophage protein n=1 Tax=Burkholderia pseudomallei (strain 1710b) TaxID=320372 RepID=Q3JY18_BURP1|nr:putative bacteriophage protein [Burkholderia pseudomallei 1710b]MBD2911298.1 type II toxin-antitoxin system RelE/ParE family toxin [Burkholderia pseudomallei]MBD2919640.1 type II toxin-antitoxin system RelE/ParE family toxin [Burkholderia pseudomallei]MBD2923526.1 type II toxin-antitoxin system RelE/ParE family toxin [Burkholderia pseudomallei]MBD2930853.1 type II toxin-antitoxin system RelE/ParE family toxin [Burkholderia pseudomallei]